MINIAAMQLLTCSLVVFANDGMNFEGPPVGMSLEVYMRQQTYQQPLKGPEQAAARGVVIALMLSVPLWIAIVGIGYWWLS